MLVWVVRNIAFSIDAVVVSKATFGLLCLSGARQKSTIVKFLNFSTHLLFAREGYCIFQHTKHTHIYLILSIKSINILIFKISVCLFKLLFEKVSKKVVNNKAE